MIYDLIWLSLPLWSWAKLALLIKTIRSQFGLFLLEQSWATLTLIHITIETTWLSFNFNDIEDLNSSDEDNDANILEIIVYTHLEWIHVEY